MATVDNSHLMRRDKAVDCRIPHAIYSLNIQENDLNDSRIFPNASEFWTSKNSSLSYFALVPWGFPKMETTSYKRRPMGTF